MTDEQRQLLEQVAATLSEEKREVFFSRVNARLKLQGNDPARLQAAISKALDGLVQVYE